MIPIHAILLRLVLAALLGGVIGYERQRHDWAAGLRTHMLVCVGAALTMMVSMDGFGDVLNKPGVSLDPSRVAAQVISGIGFLGAGTILFLKNKVIKGLTTAAGLWTTAAIGLSAGGGMYITSTATAVIVLIILAAIKPIEKKLFDKNKFTSLRININSRHTDINAIQQVLHKHHVEMDELRISAGENDSSTITILMARATLEPPSLALLHDMRNLPGVQEAELGR